MRQQLSKPYKLKNHDIETFRKNGFIKLKKIFTPNVIQFLRFEILSLLRNTFKNYDFDDINADIEYADQDENILEKEVIDKLLDHKNMIKSKK